MFPLFHYLFVTSLLCSMLRLSLPLFTTSPHSRFKVSIVSLSVFYVARLFIQCLYCFIVCFVTSLLCSMLRLSLHLFLTSLFYIFKVSIASLSVYYVTALL